MAKLVWDAVGEHLYETGVDQGVLYPWDSTQKQTEISLPKWIQSHKSETALKPLEIRHFTAFAPSSAALGEGRFSVLCG